MNKIEDWDIKQASGGFYWIYHKHDYEPKTSVRWEQITDHGVCCICALEAPKQFVDTVNAVNALDGYDTLNIVLGDCKECTHPITSRNSVYVKLSTTLGTGSLGDNHTRTNTPHT